MGATGVTRAEFIERVRKEGIAHYRDFPWRHIDDAYAVLVSEVMLQQTQVLRVERFWPRFLASFPTLDALSAAQNSDVLEMWQGLGYNRRALALKQTADICAREFGGQLPRAYDDLLALPGIGSATAAGVRAFAWNEAGVYLETNVRAVFIHEFFPHSDKVSDRELIPLVVDVCPASCSAPDMSGTPASCNAHDTPDVTGLLKSPDAHNTPESPDLPDPFDPLAGPRNWYYALLDYGAHLKASGINATRRSASYSRQSAFDGSRRQKRSWIVRYVLAAESGVSHDETLAALNEAEHRAGRESVDDNLFTSIIEDLCHEGFFHREGNNLVP